MPAAHAARPDPADLVATVHKRVTALVAGLSPDELSLAVGPWPGMTVLDVIAHLAETTAAVAAGQSVDFSLVCPASPGDGSRQLTCTGVPGLIAASQADGDRLAGVLRDDPALAAAVLVDAVTHEHDLRTALDQPAFRDDPSVITALDELAAGLSRRIAAHGMPALRVTVEQWGTIAGQGVARRCLVADRFEFVRGMTGRRSAAQVSRWNWSDEPGSYLDVLSGAGALAPADVRERDPRVPAHLADLDLTH